MNQELPSTVGYLKSLVILNVDRNRLASLPSEVSVILVYAVSVNFVIVSMSASVRCEFVRCNWKPEGLYL